MASSVGGTGGEKKLKKESVGLALRTRRVRFVSGRRVVRYGLINLNGNRTLIPLPLNFEFFCQILILLPLDRCAKGTVVHEVARVPDLLLVEICLLEDLVREEVVLLKLEKDLETRLAHRFGICTDAFGQVFEADIDKVLEGLSIAICDHLAQRNVVSECGQPELGDTGGGRSNILGQRSVFFVVLGGNLFACLDLLFGGCGLAGDDRVSAFIERLL